MAGTKPVLRKPEFIKVNQLSPGTNGHTLVVKVVDAKTVLAKRRTNARVQTQLIGFTVQKEKEEKLNKAKGDGNAKIDMFRGSMRLCVDKWGRIEITSPTDFTVKEDNNLSLIEYELVTVVEE